MIDGTIASWNITAARPSRLADRLRESERRRFVGGEAEIELFGAALWYTYFQPAATRELAAELLGHPFSTYRYHLAAGIERVADWLWQCELHGRTGA